ncbi:MAG TPA: hypothetical protein VFT45_18785 [Longimicrobium sp.]|nr:hypothetical protein [Longimicrobium sp.]
MIYACGTAMWAIVVFDAPGGWGMWVLGFAVGAPVFAVAAYIARAVDRFACWSWFFVGGWFALALLTIVGAFSYADLGDPEALTAAATAMMLLGALHYLWVRRWDFWADARLERRRPPPRAVTPEWRAARLARMGTQTVRRRTVSPQPGALWMRRTSPVRR